MCLLNIDLVWPVSLPAVYILKLGFGLSNKIFQFTFWYVPGSLNDTSQSGFMLIPTLIGQIIIILFWLFSLQLYKHPTFKSTLFCISYLEFTHNYFGPFLIDKCNCILMKYFNFHCIVHFNSISSLNVNWMKRRLLTKACWLSMSWLHMEVLILLMQKSNQFLNPINILFDGHFQAACSFSVRGTRKHGRANTDTNSYEFIAHHLFGLLLSVLLIR